jgi:hypothetical protein
MANGDKPKDYLADYMAEFESLAGGDAGEQFLNKMRSQKKAGDSLTAAAQALAGVPEAGRQAFEASKKDTLANLASEQYRRRRTPIGAALTAAEQRRRGAQRQFSQQEADMAKQGLQEQSVADLAMAKAEQEKAAMGMQAEKDLEALAALQKPVQAWKEQYDSIWGADEEGYFNTAKSFADDLPPHLQRRFFEMYIMPVYRDWGGDRANPYGGAQAGGGY